MSAIYDTRPVLLSLLHLDVRQMCVLDRREVLITGFGAGPSTPFPDMADSGRVPRLTGFVSRQSALAVKNAAPLPIDKLCSRPRAATRLDRRRCWIMVRQARSEATRRRIIDSAVDLINEIGYPASGLGDIIERAELTKGALYYHFDSKEALASTIIEEGTGSVLGAFLAACRSSSPAMENVIHGSFVVTETIRSDRVARAGARLLRTFDGFNPAAKNTFQILVGELTDRLTTAVAEGDLRAGIDPAAAGATIVGSMFGAELLSSALASGTDLRQRFVRMWELTLPSILAEESLNYYREFLARQSLRQPPPAPE